jgi:transposase
VLTMDHITEIRRRHYISGENISEIAKSLNLSRPTVRKALKAETEPVYQRQVQPTPKLGDFKEQLTDWLVFDSKLPKRRRRTAQRLFEGLQAEGYQGSYGPVQRFVHDWKLASGKQPVSKQAFVPLAFPAGETCQFDWSYEYVLLDGILQAIKVAHFRLSYSRKMFLVAYPREAQEMVLDAHARAFTYFGGVPKRII